MFQLVEIVARTVRNISDIHWKYFEILQLIKLS